MTEKPQSQQIKKKPTKQTKFLTRQRIMAKEKDKKKKKNKTFDKRKTVFVPEYDKTLDKPLLFVS